MYATCICLYHITRLWLTPYAVTLSQARMTSRLEWLPSHSNLMMKLLPHQMIGILQLSSRPCCWAASLDNLKAPVHAKMMYRIAQNFRWIKISLNAHTLYWHKNFAEFNFAHSAGCSPGSSGWSSRINTLRTGPSEFFFWAHFRLRLSQIPG